MGSAGISTWKILLLVSVLVTAAMVLSLPSLYENVSGDSIPNRPQREPPVEYQWDQLMYRVTLAMISAVIGVYSWKKIGTHR